MGQYALTMSALSHRPNTPAKQIVDTPESIANRPLLALGRGAPCAWAVDAGDSPMVRGKKTGAGPRLTSSIEVQKTENGIRSQRATNML